MSLRIALADDEPMARARLRMMLSQLGENTVIAECRNGRELIDNMQRHALDLVFTDIEMPGMDGFQAVCRPYGHEEPLIVFMTAYPQYAARAFDACALDYLVKPLESDRLAECLRRVRRAMSTSERDGFPEGRGSEGRDTRQYRFFVADGTKHTFIEASEIDWIEAADYYACLHVGKRAYLVRQTIQRLSETLDSDNFVRVHRSAIVNVTRIQHMVRDGRRGGHVILTDESRVPVSDSSWRRLIAVKTGKSQE